MIPELTEEQLNRLNSQAEARIYRLCRDVLPDRVVVLHRIEWIVRKTGEGAEDGEADFLLCDPEGGLLTLEIKGGGIEFDPASDAWWSIDGGGQKHEFKDPFRQARRAKYAILGKIQEHRRWPQLRAGKILIGHAVLFPDIDDVSTFESARSPRPVVCGRLDGPAFRAWWQDLTAYWRNRDASLKKPGKAVVSLVEAVFARPATARKLVAAHLAEEEEVRVRLTAQQGQILGMLGGRRRAAICGGAGTGKTLLAVDKAKRLAAEGFRTLLLCYNRPLAEDLAGVCDGAAGLEVASFHALCGHACNRVKEQGRDLLAEAQAAYPGASLYDVHLPCALAYSTEVLPDRYDAVVVDEGQDFRDEYWFAVEMLLCDSDKSPLYVFFDPNQALYTTAGSFPVKDQPFALVANCRNTHAIHRVCYQFYKGHKTDPPGIPGLPVETVCAPSLSAQAWAIQKLLNRFVIEEKVRGEDLAVLVVDGPNKDTHYGALRDIPLPLGLRWAFEDHQESGAILVETVSRFKGLERAGIVLWVPEPCCPRALAEMLYVGTSRAKSLLQIVGTTAGCEWVRCGG
jgi:hypothetical protein